MLADNCNNYQKFDEGEPMMFRGGGLGSLCLRLGSSRGTPPLPHHRRRPFLEVRPTPVVRELRGHTADSKSRFYLLFTRKELPMKTIVFVGIDLHKDSLTVCIMNRRGQVKFHTIPTKCKNSITRFFIELGRKHKVVAAVESVGFYHWFWDLVEPLVAQLILADASKVRAAAGRRAKTDRNDANTIARLLKDDSLPTAFVPDLELRGARNLGRHRARLQRKLTSCKASIRMEINKLGLPGPKELNTASLHKWFTAQFSKIPETSQWSFEDLQEQLAILEKQLRRTDERIERIVRDTPRFKEPVQRCRSIPGIGPLTAFLLYTETGGLERFELEGEIVSYVGLAPRTFQSADTCRHGRIGKDGPPIQRKCLINAAWTAVRSNQKIKKLFERYRRTRGKKKAIVKLAAKLLVWAWAIERNKTSFEDKRIAA